MIELLERPVAELLPSRGTLERVRRLRLGLMICGSVGLIPWIIFLSVSPPTTYVAQNWSATWVGFDALLVTLLATTAILGWQRRQLLLLTAFATGMLLVCDAWFDIMAAQPGDLWLSIATAIFGELPLAAILIVGALRPAPVPWPPLWAALVCHLSHTARLGLRNCSADVRFPGCPGWCRLGWWQQR